MSWQSASAALRPAPQPQPSCPEPAASEPIFEPAAIPESGAAESKPAAPESESAAAISTAAAPISERSRSSARIRINSARIKRSRSSAVSESAAAVPESAAALSASPQYNGGQRPAPAYPANGAQYGAQAPSYDRPAYPNAARPGNAYPGAAPPGHLGDWLNQHQGLPVQEQERLLRNDPSFNRLPPASSSGWSSSCTS